MINILANDNCDGCSKKIIRNCTVQMLKTIENYALDAAKNMETFSSTKVAAAVSRLEKKSMK